MAEPILPPVREARWPEDAEMLRALRSEVFVDEQGVPAESEWDGRDAEARHVIAEEDRFALGCGRLLPDGRIGRLAVRRELRGQGLGARLLQALLALSRESALRSVYLHAQCDAIAFYERAGFCSRGDVFEEAGIEHVDMHLELDYRDYLAPLTRVPSPQPLAQLLTAHARQARRTLLILSPDLDPALFGSADFLDALSAFLRRGAMNRLRVIAGDPRRLVQRSNPLMRLARRLPSRIELRCLPEHPQWEGDTLVLRDRDGVLSLPTRDARAGSYLPADRGRCQAALQRYEVLWNASRTDPQLRALSL